MEHDTRNWWDYQREIDQELTNIQSALFRIWDAENCEYEKWQIFKNDHRAALPLVSQTVDWTNYLLSDRDYFELNATAYTAAEASRNGSAANSTYQDW